MAYLDLSDDVFWSGSTVTLTNNYRSGPLGDIDRELERQEAQARQLSHGAFWPKSRLAALRTYDRLVALRADVEKVRNEINDLKAKLEKKSEPKPSPYRAHTTKKRSKKR